MKTLRSLVLNELADMYDAEKRLAREFPRFAKAAANARLKEALVQRGVASQSHVGKIEDICSSFGVKAKGRACDATIGLLKEADEILAEFGGSPAVDAALISAAQKIGHYKIAAYGCLSEWSEAIENEPAAVALMAMLEDERNANETLTRHARDHANEKARGGDLARVPHED